MTKRPSSFVHFQQAAQDTSTAKGKDSLLTTTITAEAPIIALTVPTTIHVLIITAAINRTINQAGRQLITVLVPTINLGNAAMNATGIPMAIPMATQTVQATNTLLVRITTHRTEDAVTMTPIM